MTRRPPVPVLFVVATTLAAGVCLLTGAPEPVRAPALLTFALVAPGLGWAVRARPGDRAEVLTLAIVLSVCLLVLVGETMALLRIWSLRGGFLVLAAAALLGLVPLTGPRRLWRRARADGGAGQ
jgi:hypothetical protein